MAFLNVKNATHFHRALTWIQIVDPLPQYFMKWCVSFKFYRSSKL